MAELLAAGAEHGAYVVAMTPLHAAALAGSTDAVDALVRAGADVEARSLELRVLLFRLREYPDKTITRPLRALSSANTL